MGKARKEDSVEPNDRDRSDKCNDDDDWWPVKKPILNINCIYKGQRTNAKKKSLHHSKMDPPQTPLDQLEEQNLNYTRFDSPPKDM
ncbi:hypothetical protein D8674_004320 [Pyrus ussuriensis x Pyrus communis]|uniref:Uncharacterized protein n=1 Tax=Pyrus ussuriensis x Pyrus communis TaxID=2448454 RepID=A0A5N5FJJ1_9ROSA|nr:hypothetical protein D8674_004320 [Pyrus ussuriensis x Pyrus communis]